MNLASTVMKLLRRWYILVPGLMLAVGTAFAVWSIVPPQYERTSTQVLIPGKGSLPPGSENPYLFIGGLSLAADVVVRATGSENMMRELEDQHPGVTFQVSRDPTTAGPVIRTSVRASTDDEAGIVLDRLTEYTSTVLVDLQDKEKIPQSERITVVTVTLDEKGVTSDRTRLILSVGAGVAIASFSVLVAALVEGLAGWRRSKRPARAVTGPTDDATSEQTGRHESTSSDDSVLFSDGDPPTAATMGTVGNTLSDRSSPGVAAVAEEWEPEAKIPSDSRHGP